MPPSVVYTAVNFPWIRRVTRVTNTNSERDKSAVALKTPEFGVNTSVNSSATATSIANVLKCTLFFLLFANFRLRRTVKKLLMNFIFVCIQNNACYWTTLSGDACWRTVPPGRHFFIRETRTKTRAHFEIAFIRLITKRFLWTAGVK